MSSVNVTTHTNTQDEAFSAQGNVSRYALPPCIAHPGKLLPSPPFPSVHHSQECLLQKYLMLAGTTRSSFSPPSPECSVFTYGRAVRVKSQNPLSRYDVNRSTNTAECHRSQLPRAHGVKMALCRGHLNR